MIIACKDFIGEHDFVNFCKFTEEYKKSGTIRVLMNSEIIREDIDEEEMYCFIVEGSAFLWH